MKLNSFDCLQPLPEQPGTSFLSLATAQRHGAGKLDSLPYSIRVLAENLLRHEDGQTVTIDHIRALTDRNLDLSIPFTPERILLQDASGIPVIADILTLQERAADTGLDPKSVAVQRRMDLVIDHAMELDESGTAGAFTNNLEHEYRRHEGRYRFLRWAQDRIPNLRVVPPGIGICHQLNLEVLADVVQLHRDDGAAIAGFDTLVGTDSHTTMINALSVLGWGVGGIEATAAALGQPIILRVPQVIGIKLTGKVQPGVLATDIALTLAALLRTHGVVQKIIEFHGPGLASLPVPDRATMANMAPEYGATMAYFPADRRTIEYLEETGRPKSTVALVQSYLQAQAMLYTEHTTAPEYAEVIDFDLSTVQRTIAGPSRPDQAIHPRDIPTDVLPPRQSPREKLSAEDEQRDGMIVIASITSCTNTSNPRTMVTAGLVARNARSHGLEIPWWVKTSLTPGSRSAADLLTASGLQESLDELGFHVAGFGCGTCMGNSGPLVATVSEQLQSTGTSAVAILSGNRNFPGRIHPDVTQTYLASPPLVVAAALSGWISDVIESDVLGKTPAGDTVTLADLWPTENEIDSIIEQFGRTALQRGAAASLTTDRWTDLPHPTGDAYPWDDEAGSIRRPPFTEPQITTPLLAGNLLGAKALLVLGDAVTTDHISPVSRITSRSEAGRWLAERGVKSKDFGSFSSRRLNHEVMLRGGFANPHIENLLVPERTGGWTRVSSPSPVDAPSEPMPVHVGAEYYAERGISAIVVAGHSYGAGSARDWAAKVTRMLGISAVIARSFERIHRTNLVAMGVIPIECPDLDPNELDAEDEIDIIGLAGVEYDIEGAVDVVIRRSGRTPRTYGGRIRVDTDIEMNWVRRGGIIPHLLSKATHG